MRNTIRLGPRLAPWMLAAAAMLLAAGGCMSKRAAESSRFEFCAQPQRLEPEDWPARETADLADRIKQTPRRINRLVLDPNYVREQPAPEAVEVSEPWPAREGSPQLPPPSVTPLRVTRMAFRPGDIREDVSRDIQRMLERPEGSITYAKPFGQGIIRRVRYWGSWSNTRFVSYSPMAKERPIDERLPKTLERYREWMERELAVAEPGIRLNDESVLSLLYEGTTIRLREPSGKPVGLVVHMAGLGSIEYEQQLLDEMLKQGWAVLRIATPGIWWYQSKPFVIESPSEINSTAAQIARLIDDMIAEPAYATEAALAYLAEVRPSLIQSPLVMVGCSAGALAAPAVVARLPDRFDAVVLVGGAANLLKTSQTSDLTDGGLRIVWKTPELGSPAEWNQLYDAYLQASKLDPYNTARTFVDKPVLVVQAALDSTVPADGGELLWERLDRPDRWTFRGGHRLLFWRLADYAEPIAEWCRNALPTTAATAPQP